MVNRSFCLKHNYNLAQASKPYTNSVQLLFLVRLTKSVYQIYTPQLSHHSNYYQLALNLVRRFIPSMKDVIHSNSSPSIVVTKKK